jgi:hypothetical protein
MDAEKEAAPGGPGRRFLKLREPLRPVKPDAREKGGPAYQV